MKLLFTTKMLITVEDINIILLYLNIKYVFKWHKTDLIQFNNFIFIIHYSPGKIERLNCYDFARQNIFCSHFLNLTVRMSKDYKISTSLLNVSDSLRINLKAYSLF